MVSFLFKRKSGAVFFTLDTLIAGLIVLVTIILIFSIYSSRPAAEDTFHELNNYMSFISSTTLREVREEYYNWYEVPPLSSDDLDLYVHQKVYKMFLDNDTVNASHLVGNLSLVIIPAHFGFEYVVNDSVIFLMNNHTREHELEKTSITNRILTFYINESDYIHLTTTNITVWS